MNNETYWRNRIARQMYEYVEDAETTNLYLRQGYKDALEYLQKEAVKVFERFQSKYGLTRQEAETLLKTIRNPQDIQLLRNLLAQNPTRADLLAELESGAYGNRLYNLANMFEQVDKVVLPMATATLSAGETLFKNLAEKSYYQTIFNLQQYCGYGGDIKHISEKDIETVLNTKWGAKDFKTSVWSNTQALADNVKREMLLNTLTGRSLFKATKSLQQRMGAGYNDTRRVIRTESTYICNQMQIRADKEYGVKRYVYCAVLDLRTSKVCRSLDRKSFPIDGAKVGDINHPLPPMHPYCRSTTIADYTKEVVARMKRSAIAPKLDDNGNQIVDRNGKPVYEHIRVPASMTYAEWYAKYIAKNESEGKA